MTTQPVIIIIIALCGIAYSVYEIFESTCVHACVCLCDTAIIIFK